MWCKNCGAEIKENQKFCPKCGHIVDEINEKGEIATPQAAKSHKKAIKIIVTVIIIVAVIAIGIIGYKIFYPMYLVKSFNNNGSDNEITTQSTTQAETETTTQEHKLSSDCSYVLAEGYDGDNYYELVANQIDDYPESKIEMGVIKNNKWLIEMTSDFPFLSDNWFNDKGAAFRDDDDPHDPFESGSYHFEYVGEGTFYYYFQEQYVAYQANQTIFKPDTGYHFRLFNFFIEERTDFLNNGEFLATDEEKGFCYYNLNTGVIKPMGGAFSDGNAPDRNGLYGIHDGLFYAEKRDKSFGGSGYSYKGFFNLKGKLIIDLSKYDISDYHDYKFVDGKYTITCSNDNGVQYDITFDNTGKIVKQEKSN